MEGGGKLLCVFPPACRHGAATGRPGRDGAAQGRTGGRSGGETAAAVDEGSETEPEDTQF